MDSVPLNLLRESHLFVPVILSDMILSAECKLHGVKWSWLNLLRFGLCAMAMSSMPFAFIHMRITMTHSSCAAFGDYRSSAMRRSDSNNLHYVAVSCVHYCLSHVASGVSQILTTIRLIVGRSISQYYERNE